MKKSNPYADYIHHVAKSKYEEVYVTNILVTRSTYIGQEKR
jgi:hypothetical protein